MIKTNTLELHELEHINLKTITDKFSDLMFDYPFRVPAV